MDATARTLLEAPTGTVQKVFAGTFANHGKWFAVLELEDPDKVVRPGQRVKVVAIAETGGDGTCEVCDDTGIDYCEACIVDGVGHGPCSSCREVK